MTKSEKHYIFDVDGTLTPSRGKIDPDFAVWFQRFVTINTVCLVTGSDRLKTIEQIGETLFNMCDKAYNCSGNDVYRFGMTHKKSEWKLAPEELDWLNKKLEVSEWKIQTGNHIEQRTGCANYSTVGRNASWSQRKSYYLWDQKRNERETIAKEFTEQFPHLDAKVGGETGFDIFPKGKDKRQILTDFPEGDRLYFFGDRIDPAGNDYSIAQGMAQRGFKQGLITGKGSGSRIQGNVFKVKDWQDTWNFLKYMDNRMPMYKGK